MRLKDLENHGVMVKYLNKFNDTNIVHGKLVFVSKDRIIVIGEIEHIIQRSKIQEFRPIKYHKLKK